MNHPVEHPLAGMLMYQLYQAWAQSNPVFVRLCEKGWLRRLPDSVDRRVVRIEATADGLDRYRALLPEVLRLNDLLVQDLDAAEVALLRDLLTRIEQRGRRMAQDNIVSEKASRREGGTRRAQYG